MRDESGFERPFVNDREPDFRSPSPRRASEMMAALAYESDLETVINADSNHDAELIRHLDYGSLAFDVLAAFDSHGYHELSRPGWLGDHYLRGKVWFGDDIKMDAKESQLRPGNAIPERVEVLACDGEQLINRSPAVSPNVTWHSVLRVPATLFGEVSAGGISPPEEANNE